MSDYNLEIKQIVDYPRCRIYRQFIKSLCRNRSIRTSGGSGLFFYTVLCNYANFRTSYLRIDGINYIIKPGQWLCTVSEITKLFRVRFQWQALAILDNLQERHLITYNILGHGKLVKFNITNWCSHNRVLDYNAPCQKDTGFFFLSVDTANEIVSYGKCSEMDALLDLWLHTVYNDDRVQGSGKGPVVYFRNGSGRPLISYSALALRWGVSKTTVSRYLQKLQELGHIDLFNFAGTHGTAIYLKGFVSTMFQVSDVLIDKESVAMALNIRLDLPEVCPEDTDTSVPETIPGVPNSHISIIVEKIKKVLGAQGVSCFDCAKVQYQLLPLLDECRVGNLGVPPAVRFLMEISCDGRRELYRFELQLQREVSK